MDSLPGGITPELAYFSASMIVVFPAPFSPVINVKGRKNLTLTVFSSFGPTDRTPCISSRLMYAHIYSKIQSRSIKIFRKQISLFHIRFLSRIFELSMILCTISILTNKRRELCYSGLRIYFSTK